MSLQDWIADTVHYARTESPRMAASRSSRDLFAGAARRIGGRLPNHGEFVFDHDWDVLIVLDACRVDALEAVAPDYDWLGPVGSMESRASHSREWMQENFVGKYAMEKARTAHVTWNAFSDYELVEDEWAELVEVWRYRWDDELGALHPRWMTDAGIATWRETDAERFILHYMQPHVPYRTIDGHDALPHELVGEIDVGRTTIWDLLRAGDVSHDEAWDAYLDNLRWVLDDLAVLRMNLDAEKAILTADHGECFGEWGLYGHPDGVRIRPLINVPWVDIQAEDTVSYTPESTQSQFSGSTEDTQPSVEDRLKALGYKEPG